MSETEIKLFQPLIRLRYDLLCVAWDVKPYTLTHWGSSKIISATMNVLENIRELQ